ncbi:MAG: phenylalanine--tRNA ligase subunit beta, partial [Bdellovibrionia bacterium]
IILPADAPIGVAFADYKGLNDILFELKVTPNRADCLSHFGLARELSALLGQEYHLPFHPFTEGSGSTAKEITLDLQEPDLCPRYAGRFIKGVKVGPSPSWLKTRIEAVGLKSINNVVDVTNYVMMELGQPLHAFDVRQLKGKKIIIAKAVAGETFTTLDKTELKLKGGELTIRDGERAVALAGIVGGLTSCVVDDTTDIFVESAYFTPATVRKTSRLYGIETDSCYRFSRGVNPEAVLLALNRACELIQKAAGGTIFSQPHDAYPKPVTRQEIVISTETVSQRLGYAVSEKEFTERMTSIECTVAKAGGSAFKILPPLYRWDLTILEDLVEEFARLNGYEKIPETLPALNYAPTKDEPGYTSFQNVSRALRQQGFQQGQSFAFIARARETELLGDIKKLQFLKVGETIPLMNPLSEDLNVMRRTVTTNLIGAVSHNIRYGTQVGRLFEIGFVFAKDKDKYVEMPRLGLAAWGAHETLWQKPGAQAPLIFELKAKLEEAMRTLRAGPLRFDELQRPPDFLHPGQAIGIAIRGQLVGYLGEMHPALKESMKIRSGCALCEIDLEKVFETIKPSFKVSTPSKFPAVERDLAFVVPVTVPVQNVLAEIRKTAGPVLTDVVVFDVFQLDPERRSIAFRMSLQDSTGTLNEEALTGLQNKLIEGVTKKLGVTIRS